MRIEKNKRFKWLCYILAVIIPLILVVSWHHINTIYPSDDAGDYYKTGQQIYQVFKTNGFFAGVNAAYLHRGWRPIFYPVVIAFFLILTKGAISLTALLAMSFCYFIFLTFIYLLSREFLPPFRSALCTIILGTTSWLISSTYYSFSEIWLYACAIATLYYLKKAEFFSSAKSSLLLGIFMGFTMVSKPIEFLMALGIFLIFYIFYSAKIKNITPKDLTLSLSMIAVTALIVILPAVLFKSVPKQIVLFGAPLILLINSVLLFFSKRRSPLVMCVFACSIISGIWWLPALRNYLDYVYVGGLGDMAKLYNLGNRKFFDASVYFFSQLGGYVLLFMFVVAIIGYIFAKNKEKCFSYFKFYAAISIPMIIIPILIMSLSPSTDPRRASLSFTILILMTAVLALQPEFGFPKLRAFLLMIVAGLQILMVSSATFNVAIPKFNYINHFVKGTPPPIKGGDPSLKTFQELCKLPYLSGSIAAFTLTLDLQMGNWGQRPFDPGTLQLLAEKNNSSFSFGYPWNFLDLEDGYAGLKASYNKILLDVSTLPPEGAEIKAPYSRLTVDLIKRWKDSTLAEIGFRPVYQFNVKGKTLVLLKSINSVFSSKENFASAINGAVAGATDSQPGFSYSGLNDEDELSAWGSSETTNDTICYVTLPAAHKAKIIKVSIFNPSSCHLRDISIVATKDEINGRQKWHIIRARFIPEERYEEKITIPNAADKTIVTIELDKTDNNWQEYKTYGLACFSGSRSYKRNYVSRGNGIYIREMGVF